mgnify:CR=1 FL=1
MAADPTRRQKSILFLDLATTMGFCEGVIGETPIYGSTRLAPPGSSSDAVFAGAIRWLGTRLQGFKPQVFAYEAPRDPRHMGNKTNISTALVLLGLCGAVEGVANLSGVYDIRKADVNGIRKFFLPQGSPRTGSAVKHAVERQCRVMGYAPTDDNAADAIAGWHFMCALIAPDIKPASATPLFGD